MKSIIMIVMFVTLALGLSAWTAQAEDVPAESTKVDDDFAKTSSSVTRGFYQAPAEAFVVTPWYETTGQSGSIRGGGKLREYGPFYTLSTEYGWSDELSSELVLEHFDNTLEVGGSKFDKKGLADVRLTIKGQKKVSNGSSAHYGIHLKESFGPKERTLKFTGGGGIVPTEVTAREGGRSVTPYIGYQIQLADNIVGVRLTQTIWGSERTTENKGSAVDLNIIPKTSLERGGGLTEVRAFGERHFGDKFMLGANLKYKWTSKIQEKMGASDYVTITSPRQVISVGLQPTYKINNDVVLLGSANYQTLVTKEITYNRAPLNDGSIMDLSLGGRFTF